MRSTLSFSAVLLASSLAQAASTQVKVYFVEALAPRDTTSSERFQKDFENAIQTARKLLAPKLASCGYALDTQTVFYDASDPLQARERAEQASQQGAWLVVGPRRSNHYILLAQGAPNTPTVSLMASASEVARLGGTHLTLSPLNAEMAKAAAHESARKIRGHKQKTYVSIVGSDCATCRDFAEQFDAAAKQEGLRSLAKMEVQGETPETTDLIQKIKALKPTFILNPNYSRLSSHLMAEIHSAAPRAFFVGADGWGDSKFGFVQNGRNIVSAEGFSVRGFPPIEEGLRTFPTGRTVLDAKSPAPQPLSGPGLGIMKILDSTVDLLCQSKPKDLNAFKEAFVGRGKRAFSAPWGVSFYRLKKGELHFERTEGARR